MKIEKLKNRESDSVGHLVTNAFYAKFKDKTTISKNVLQKIVTLVWIEEAENFGMSIYTVKSEDIIVGAFGITSRQKTKISLRLLAKVSAIIKVIGIKDFIAILKTGLETDRTPDSGEWYIDFVVVKEDFRNQNIGHTIMSELDDMITHHSNAEKLSLYVLKDNDRARHLYEKYGFVEQSISEKSNYHFMIKNSSDIQLK